MPAAIPEGAFRLERVSGLLPPLSPLRKRIRAGAGVTALPSLPGLPFRLEVVGDDVRLRYRRPLGFLVDELRPGRDGCWEGRATAFGVTYGHFRMRPER